MAENELQRLVEHTTLSWQEIGKQLNISASAARSQYARQTGRWEKAKRHVDKLPLNPKDALTQDLEQKEARVERVSVEQKYKAALEEIDVLSDQIDVLSTIKKAKNSIKIESTYKPDHSEAVAVVVASDWHLEEEVRSSTVNGVNEFNLEIAELRAKEFFKNTVRLIRMCQQDVTIETLVFAALGDFISAHIHEELVETTSLAPVYAAIFAKNLLVTGLKFILAQTDLKKIYFVGKVGNHSRMTKKCRHATETGHSIEKFVYDAIAAEFANEPRVEFDVNDAYHTYVEIFGKTLRLHHGHNIQYQGGIGGITVPVNKAIAQWNQIRTADIDIFGHFHQQMDLENFICNGSLVGFNAFAVSIKAKYQEPKQTFFLLDKKRGKTISAPIVFSK